MTFDDAFTKLIGNEGAFSDNPKDPGNWTGGKVGVGTLLGTKYGIAANTYPHLDIKNLTLDQAKAIYRKDFWRDDLPGVLAFQYFDAAVNHGARRSAQFLQRALGLPDDGIIGPITLEATRNRAIDSLVMLFNAQRILFYTSLGTFGTFGAGWMNRIAHNLETAAKG